MSRQLRKVIERRQDFRSTPDYPQGFVVETLDCGHEHIEVIAEDLDDDSGIVEQIAREQARNEIENPNERHSHNAKRRRCEECERLEKKRNRASS